MQQIMKKWEVLVFAVNLPRKPRGLGLETMQMVRPCHFPLVLSRALGFSLHSLTAACYIGAPPPPPLVVSCNDIQISRVICQVHFDLGSPALCQRW